MIPFDSCIFFTLDPSGKPMCTNKNRAFTECDGPSCDYYEDANSASTSEFQEVPKLPELGDSLLEAHEIITQDRMDSYGKPENCFQLIANYWNVYINRLQTDLLIAHKVDLTQYELKPLLKPKDVAHLMMLLKIARSIASSSKRDNYLDLQGYAAIAADVLLKHQKENNHE